MSLPRLEPSTPEKRWVSVANWATPVGFNKAYCTTTLCIIFQVHAYFIKTFC
ncbi:hypothetical protein Hanom_Chr08g00704751 [Helianthus anomalus]